MGMNQIEPDNTNKLKSVLDDCEVIMREKGCEFERSEDSKLVIKLMHKYHIMSYDDDDDQFLHIFSIFEGAQYGCSRNTLLKHINKLNHDIKVVKITIDDDNDVIFAVEMFLYNARYFTEIFRRHIESIDAASKALERMTQHHR